MRDTFFGVIPSRPSGSIFWDSSVGVPINSERERMCRPRESRESTTKFSGWSGCTVPVKAEETATEEITAVPEKEPVAEEVVTAAENTPVEEAPKEEVQVEDTPCEDTPAEEVQVEDAPVADTPVEEAPKEEVQVEDTPVEDTPAAENIAVEEETWALSAEPEDQPRKRKPRTQSAPAKPVTPPDDDDLGIIQPEFGF